MARSLLRATTLATFGRRHPGAPSQAPRAICSYVARWGSRALLSDTETWPSHIFSYHIWTVLPYEHSSLLTNTTGTSQPVNAAKKLSLATAGCRERAVVGFSMRGVCYSFVIYGFSENWSWNMQLFHHSRGEMCAEQSVSEGSETPWDVFHS